MSFFKKANRIPKSSVNLTTENVETVKIDNASCIMGRETLPIQIIHQQLMGDVILEMVRIPAGSFTMGSPRSQGHRDEEPQHYVRVKGFYISQTTITQQQWKAVMKRLHPCRGKGLDLPVDRVSFNEARAFCERLERITGRHYRLPSEAEWEYACRAGSVSDFSFGNTISTELCNYVGLHTYGNSPKGEYRHGPIKGGSFPANGFGIHDMHGNLWEWCMDAWHEDYTGAPMDDLAWLQGGTEERVLRGGSWHDPPDLCRSASRLKMMPTEGEDFTGLRIAFSEDIDV